MITGSDLASTGWSNLQGSWYRDSRGSRKLLQKSELLRMVSASSQKVRKFLFSAKVQVGREADARVFARDSLRADL